MRHPWIKAAALALLLTPGVAALAQTSPVAQTADGAVRGTMRGEVEAFLGIPYARPPVGPLRWRAPLPALPWKGTREASAFSPACPQVLNPPEGRAPWTPEYMIPGPMAEDCLYLNVWRPAHLSGHAPVLVFIHGGGGTEGSTSVPAYDGAALARNGIVVVTINYRLGILAYLSHPELSREQGGASGNYGLQDVIAALRWVRANAAAFGGDPVQVTVSGQSAGAGYVTQLIASPIAKGLFARAITESGSQWNSRLGPVPLAAGEQQSTAFATAVGAPSLAQLRAMPADALIKQAAQFGAQHGRIAAVIDGRVLTTDPNTAQAAAGFNDTPILSGFNWDEDSGFDPKFANWTKAELAERRSAVFGPLADQAAALYPVADDADALKVGPVMARERYRAAVYEWAKRRALVSRSPIYMYFFNHPEPGPTQVRYGSFHSSEIPYVFGNLDAPRPFTAQDHAVSERMQARWVAFVKGGAPDGAGLTPWPAFSAPQPAIMLLGDKEGPEPVLPPEKLRLSDALAALPDAPKR